MTGSSSERRILLVDCDAFYVQVARLVDPDGAGRAPLLIVGGSQSGRGVVTSASYETRAYGVRSAMPTGQALKLCPGATVVGVPRVAVTEKSREVRSTLEELAPVVQAASIDEFYLDLSGTERLFSGEDLEETALRIRREVLRRTRISVSIGGGTRRIIAKVAASQAKPAGVLVVRAGAEQTFLDPLELAKLPGIGPALAEELRRKGLVRVRDAVAVQREWLERWLGTRRGSWLHRRVRGVDGSEVDPTERRRSISAERTFFEDLERDDELERKLLEVCGSVGRSLRAKGLRARTVTVKLRDHDFRTRTRSRTLSQPIESDVAVFGAARELLRELRAEQRVPARLVGVGLSALGNRATSAQLELFAASKATESERDRDVSRIKDQLRSRFGRSVLEPGRVFEGGGR